MSTCVRKCTLALTCNIGANSLNVVSRTFPHFSQSMLTPMILLSSPVSVDAFTRCSPPVPTAICILIACLADSTTFSSIKITVISCVHNHFEIFSNFLTDLVHCGAFSHSVHQFTMYAYISVVPSGNAAGNCFYMYARN